MNKILYFSLKLLTYISIFMLIDAVYALIVDRSVVITLAFLFPASWILFLWVPFMKEPVPQNLSLRESFKVAAIGWLLMSFFGAIPFILSGYLNPLDAWFESMSGFTATGLTMFTDVESLPKSILLWRSLTEWIGGVGVIALFLSVMYRTSRVVQSLYFAEGRSDKTEPTIVGTVRKIWGIYLFYTLLFALIFYLLKVPLFDAINISMTALATGGFAVTNNSIAAYSPYVAIAMIFAMAIGGISFVSHINLFKGRVREFFSIELKAMVIIIVLFSTIMLLHLAWLGESWNEAALQTFFHVTSALTGTGFSISDLANLTSFDKTFLILSMIFGGAYGSTSSALKLIRVVVLVYGIVWYVKVRLYPKSAIIPFKIGKKVFESTEVRDVSIYTTTYLFMLLLGAMIFMAYGNSLVNSLFEVASAEGNVGLTVGITSPFMPWVEKLTLILEMWFGRLEIFPILILLADIVKK
ncbi:TrkH family potassium uptake protein [Candidatus Aciduliprofundum boonei]|uniref:Cation transporter n=1 Tax=Aciduliprofundum boonei (strain DSM 19572 / T469) TaxID=439481 RepID=B5IA11_ACIB4|nr:TrkH family potassium uptake protein [Candidatus Aciduliprofundum boonei]ADD08354.1 cation transporter [Aciduliprofundum boonei T469]EDY36744.1 Cation transport protein [Aciduliprofundum boonei T469]HII54698.1 TrkH family potassium uptake protein [Candidatus Aciduliprofundum boonei]